MSSSATAAAPPHRVDWVDVARGLCIVLVVTMHSTLGVEAAAGQKGWMGEVVAFATPFRIPVFFLVAGLFLARGLDRPWRDYLDRKVVHFAYFYALWVTLQFAVKAPVFMAEQGAGATAASYLLAFVQPFGTLWFIYLLPIFYVVARLLRSAHPGIVLAVGAALEVAPVATGWVVIDEFAGRFVYFYAGYALARAIFAMAERARRHRATALAALAGWAGLNGAVVGAGAAALPGVSLGLGALGAAAVVAGAALLAPTTPARPLAYCGRNSIVIYLAFFLPMAAARTVLLALGIVPDVGTVSVMVTLTAVVAPLVLARLVRDTPAAFLFARPAWARLSHPRRVVAAQ